MDSIGCSIDSKPYSDISIGVHGLLAFALNHVTDKMEGMESDFKKATGVKYRFEMEDDSPEARAWIAERGRP
jgi:hypothetical protein